MKADKATLSKTIGQELSQMEVLILLDHNLNTKLKKLKRERRLITVLLNAV